ncbi:MAG TPA: SDR family oxidoreductase [Microvirga sp.]|jgi:short-subunit dehydrogenase|nr:SDR family oxidoreductase [Microvirga sp.]
MTVRLKPVAEQVVVITGASSGIGLATARLFAERGARGLVLVARNQDALQSIAQELSAQGTRAIAVAADTGSRHDLERVHQTAVDTFGGYDTWVNDAAVAVYGKLLEVPLEDQRRLFEVNYWGMVNGSLLAAQHFVERGGGAVINVGSVLSERTMILQTQYSASKHAIKAFTDGLRMELERDGRNIAVTLIKPAAIDTPYPEHARNYMEDDPRVPPPAYDPKLVAKAIVFASETMRRELTVGFGGWVIGAMGTVAPRLTDKIMEATGYASQTTKQPERRAMRDNLYRSRQDGDEYSSLPGEPRKTSFFLEAQMHPVAAAVILAGVGAAIAASLFAPGAVKRSRSRRATPMRRYERVERRTGNGHDKPAQGPGYRARHDPYEGRVLPRH